MKQQSRPCQIIQKDGFELMTIEKITQDICKTDICQLKEVFGECCGRYYARQRKDTGRVYWTDRQQTYIQRFWAHVVLTADDQRCWNWTGLKTPFGYGIFSIYGDQNLAHRMAWFFTYGVKPTEWILHKNECHNTSCVNPNHLYDGTPKDNAQDRITDGTQSRGESHGMALIRDEDARQVKHWIAMGKTRQEIGILTGVSLATISSIKSGKQWRHIKI